MRLNILRPPKRQALFIRQGMSKDSPGLMFPLYKIGAGELDELIRAILAKQGITDEATVKTIIDKAEQDYETRIVVSEARAMIRKLMAERKRGMKLMQNGFRKWQVAFYPALTRFKQGK